MVPYDGGALRIVIATLNPHKMRELGGMLSEHSLVPLPYWAEMPSERGATFSDNAVPKAHAAAAATNIPAVADDSITRTVGRPTYARSRSSSPTGRTGSSRGAARDT